MFWDGRCAFGQTGRAQAHLKKSGVGVGDVFLFFGLFARDGRDRHHRIFGYLEVEEVRPLGNRPSERDDPDGPRRHPYTIEGSWDANRFKARTAPPSLRLTKLRARPSVWAVPAWLKEAGLTFHRDPARWVGDGELRVASRGQEFVTDIGEQTEPLRWLHDVKAAIRQ
jgi:hypothetical protein